MKILERGTPPEDRVYVSTCRNCKSKIEFLQSEGRIYYDPRDGNFIQVLCPVCCASIVTSV